MMNLLDAIAAAADTLMLSDLHQNEEVRKQLPRVLRKIPECEYALPAWQAAVRYILRNNSLSPQSEREARELLGQVFEKYYGEEV